MKKLLKKIISAVLVLAVISSAFVLTNRAKADTFYKTFVSLCEGQQWLVDFVSTKFLENGQRFGNSTAENDPILLDITELYVPASGISSIPDAVKYFKNLTYVDVSYNDLSDISPLSACTGIVYLRADGNNIASVDTAAFAGLETLSLADNLLTVMPVLSANKSLKYINLSHNNIAELTSLEGLGGITSLNLSANKLTSAAGTGSWTMALESGDSMLDLSYNYIRSVEALKHITNIKTLDLSHNFVSLGINDIPMDVETLDLSDNSLASAGELATKTNLKNLDLSNNNLTTLENFNKCANLVSLDLASNNITDTRGLDGFKKLQTLNLSGNGLNDMPLCTVLTQLKNLDLSHNNIGSFALLNRYPELVSINASYNKATDFSGINTLRKLVYADFSYNNVKTVYNKLYLTTPSLRVLKLSGNPLPEGAVKNIFINGYSEVWLEDCDLTNKIPDMSQYPNVSELYISGAKVSAADVANVFKRTDYTGLGLGGTILDDSVKEELKKQTDLITLNLDKTVYVDGYFEFIVSLDILELSLAECDLTTLPKVLFTGGITKINCADNKIASLTNDILLSSMLGGAVLDLSGNAIMENRAMYLYMENAGYDVANNYLDINADRKLTFGSSKIRCEVGSTVDIYSQLKMSGIYDELQIGMPAASQLEIKLVQGKAAKVTIDPATLNVTVNKKISVLEALTIEVSLKGNRRDDYTARVTLYTEASPVTDGVYDGIDIIYGIELGTTYQALLDSYGFDEGYKVEVFYPDETAVAPDDTVGTGAVIVVTDIESGAVIYKRTAVVFGDCNGNGKINSTDIMLIKRHIFNQSKLTGVYFYAADVYDNGVINSTDFMFVKRHIFKQSFISQKR